MTKPMRQRKEDRLLHSGASPEEIQANLATGPFDRLCREMDIVDSQRGGVVIGFKRAERCYQHQPGPDHNRPLEGLTMADSKPICSVAGCGNISYLKGVCNAHYLRLRRHGSAEGGGTSRGSPLAWLEALVAAPPDDCVNWPFASNGNGYGWASYRGQRFGAHRLSLVLASGGNPEEMDAAHSCHNRVCVNPKHISWKTRTGNMLDKRRDGTNGSQLSAADVAAIRASSETGVALARRYGLTPSAIGKIRKGVTWK